MDFLSRDDMPLDSSLWDRIDNEVIETSKKHLKGRRFLPIFHSGSGSNVAYVDGHERTENFKDGIVVDENRKVISLPQLYSDFWLYWRDIEHAKTQGFSVDLSATTYAAKQLARREDELIFYGNNDLGLDGLLSVKGSQSLKRGDWTTGENSFLDIAKAVTMLETNGFSGTHSLIVSPDLYLELERIQPGTGLLEVDRIKNVLSGKLIKSTVLKPKTALVVCNEQPYMDLQVGVDISSAYVELADNMNHHFRILETIALRIKEPQAIVILK